GCLAPASSKCGENHYRAAFDMRDIFVMSLTNRPLRRMLDQVFDQAQRLLHVDAMAVYAPFTIQTGQAHAGKVIYASDDATARLLAAHALLDNAILAAVAEGQSHVYCVGADASGAV